MSPNSSIAHFRITSKLGAGGMGAVYRATDTKLNRDVAIKVLPDSFADDPDRLTRFTREAQLLASLNHPNIAAIHGVENRAIVMELVEGQMLQGPLSVEEALPLIHQLIDALEYAHEKGIVHRDLKPANIKVTPQGRLKVLDFGIAKAISNEVSERSTADPVNSPTITIRSTIAGVVMGTAAYMSPEQARGQDVDKRADIWAFGVVVYELITGKRLFDAPTVSDTIAAVLLREPDLDAVPLRMRRLLRACLARDPRQRLRDISGARIILEDDPEVRPAAGTKAPWIAAAAGVLLAAAFGTIAWRDSRPVDKPLVRLRVDQGPDVSTINTGVGTVISADGTRVVFPIKSGDQVQLATRLLSETNVTPIAGTAGASYQFLSPDGQWVGFFADSKLKKTQVTGGATVNLCDASIPRGGAWGEDGNIIASLDGRRLWRVPAAGGEPQPVTSPEGAESQRWPQLLPGGQAVLYTTESTNTPDWENARLAVLSLKTGQTKVVHRGGYFGRYLPTGHLVYVHEGTLFGIAFDPVRLETRGAPVPLLGEVVGNNAWGGGNFDFSNNGAMVYSGGTYTLNPPLGWFDRNGKHEPFSNVAGGHPRLSPDGKLLALEGNNDLVIYDLQRGTSARVTFNPTARNRGAVWAPGGKHIAYYNSTGIWLMRADGSGQPQPILANSGSSPAPASFAFDGRMVFSQSTQASSRDIFTMPIDFSDPDHIKPGKVTPFVSTPGADVDAAFSPDGKFVAFATNESGVYQVFVQLLSGAGRWQISTDSGRFPVWSRGTRELVYLNNNGFLMVVDYKVEGSTFSAGKPGLWAPKPIWLTGNIRHFDLAPDGKRVAAAESASERGSTYTMFLFNFFDEVKRRMP